MGGETKPSTESANAEKLDEELVTKAETVFINGPAMMVARLGFGGVLGFCSGYAIKQASKALAVVVGGAVVLLQTMQYFGYIEVKWQKIQKDTMRAISSDGKESFGVKDVHYWSRKMIKILTHQGPTAGGFAGGIYLGLGL